MPILFTQLSMAAIIVIGMVAIFYPEKVQAVDLRISEALMFGIPNPFVSFLRSPEYLVLVRLLGALTLVLAMAAEYALFVGK
jgi:hypothetical protein